MMTLAWGETSNKIDKSHLSDPWLVYVVSEVLPCQFLATRMFSVCMYSMCVYLYVLYVCVHLCVHTVSSTQVAVLVHGWNAGFAGHQIIHSCVHNSWNTLIHILLVMKPIRVFNRS